MIKAVIFDMDGVIIDSEPIYQMWLEEFLEYQGISVPESELRTIPGISTQAFKEKVEKWWKCCGVTNKTGEEIDREFDTFCKDKKISYKNITSPYLKPTLEHLRNAGFQVTQATVSRDIRKLKLSKVPARDGKQKYALLNGVQHQMSEKYVGILREAFVSMDSAQNILVIKTVSGMAMALATALDNINWKEILGCVAGDDTVMCVIRTQEDTEAVMDELKKIVDGKA